MMSKLEHSSLSPELQGLLSLLVRSNSASLKNNLPFPLLGSKLSVETSSGLVFGNDGSYGLTISS